MTNDMNHEANPQSVDRSTRPTAITAVDRLRTIYGHPGPYTTVYLATRPLLHESEADTRRRWKALRRDLEVQGSPLSALDAIEARLTLPNPEHTAATAVVAAADGTTVVDHALEPPADDLGLVDDLPYAAPLLEWDQRRIAHLIVTLDDAGADVVLFGLDHYLRIDTVDMVGAALVDVITDRVAEINGELIVISGARADTAAMTDRLRQKIPAHCRIATEPVHITTDDLADATVRHVSDTAARATVRHLREMRFLATHGAAVDGIVNTVQALADGTADLLLIHDDPADDRRCWIGHGPRQLSIEPRKDHDRQARLVDAAIRSAVLQDIPVHIIPTTGPAGPDDNTAAITNDLG